MLETVERIAATADAPLSAQPNAGKPRHIEGPHDLPLVARVHGVLRPPVHREGRAAGRRLLRDDARAHPADQARRRLDIGRAAGGRRSRVGAVTAGEPTVAPIPRDQKSRLAHAMARGTFVHLVELTPPKGHEFAPTIEEARALEDPRRRRRQHPGRAAGRGADERRVDGRPDRAAGGDRDRAPLRVPGPEPARDGVGPARRSRHGHPERAAHHRRPATPGRLRVRHRRLRRGLDRPDQRRQPAESRRGHRRRADDPADRLSHRRRGQPDGAQPRR